MQPVRIGRGDVGKRVTVRYRTHAPKGEPQRTDAVGYLRAWDGGRLSIERRDGSLTVVDEHDLIAARTVGPPPRRRTPRDDPG